MNQDAQLADLARQAFEDYFHKIRAEVTPELWEIIFCKGWHAAMQQTYMPNLSDIEHPEQHARPDSPELMRSDVMPGKMHCAKCSFSLIRTNLYVHSGTVGAGDNKTEPCPNGCGPLWPVTWKQEARECWRSLESLFDRMKAAEDALAAIRRAGPQVVDPAYAAGGPVSPSQPYIVGEQPSEQTARFVEVDIETTTLADFEVGRKTFARGLVFQPDPVEAFVPLVDTIHVAVDKMSQAAHDVLAERVRQINVKGWTPRHDDEHEPGELAEAAACYASSSTIIEKERWRVPAAWPWDLSSWKPDKSRRMLIKAGALIIAEIERLDRADGKVK